MKKLLSIMLVLTMALTLLAGLRGSWPAPMPAASSGPVQAVSALPRGR